LLNIVVVKSSRWFVHLHCPDCFHPFAQRQKGDGASRVVAFGVGIFLFVRAAYLALFCAYESKLTFGDHCYPEKVLIPAVTARVYLFDYEKWPQ
jgi:hypothetical protein